MTTSTWCTLQRCFCDEPFPVHYQLPPSTAAFLGLLMGESSAEYSAIQIIWRSICSISLRACASNGFTVLSACGTSASFCVVVPQSWMQLEPPHAGMCEAPLVSDSHLAGLRARKFNRSWAPPSQRQAAHIATKLTLGRAWLG